MMWYPVYGICSYILLYKFFCGKLVCMLSMRIHCQNEKHTHIYTRAQLLKRAYIQHIVEQKKKKKAKHYLGFILCIPFPVSSRNIFYIQSFIIFYLFRFYYFNLFNVFLGVCLIYTFLNEHGFSSFFFFLARHILSHKMCWIVEQNEH